MRAHGLAGLALILLGILLYAVFGLSKGVAFDEGPYSILIVPVAFGIAVLLIGRERKPVP